MKFVVVLGRLMLTLGFLFRYLTIVQLRLSIITAFHGHIVHLDFISVMGHELLYTIQRGSVETLRAP